MEKQVKEPSTKKILFTSALPWELKVLKEIFWNQPETFRADFLVLWVWCLEATLKLTKKLIETHYDFVINSWICWYKETRHSVIQIARSIYLPTHKELLVPQFLKVAPRVSIICSETPIFESTLLWEENYVDMESYAIEKVCEHFKVARLILKVPYDKIWEETKNFDKNLALKYFKNTLSRLGILSPLNVYLVSHTKTESSEKYHSHLRLTVSEKIIFEKLFQKYQALSPESFEVFFNAHKKLDIKIFLQKLTEACEKLIKL